MNIEGNNLKVSYELLIRIIDDKNYNINSTNDDSSFQSLYNLFKNKAIGIHQKEMKNIN